MIRHLSAFLTFAALAFIVAGVAYLAGPGWALIAAGVALVVFIALTDFEGSDREGSQRRPR